ncbi:MAG: PEPxxWA-CTERM sorting domain-containing protein, partial [Caulobacteraceae bacterium]
GEFVHGTPLLFDNGVAGPVAIVFLTPLTSLSGISAQANLQGAYTATETFFGTGGQIGIESYNGVSNLGPEGSIPTFASFDAGGALITSVVYTVTNDGSGFALGGAAGGGAVPEPATWGMLLVGMGLVGGAMRRRTVATA